jgi:hypothetical protein
MKKLLFSLILITVFGCKQKSIDINKINNWCDCNDVIILIAEKINDPTEKQEYLKEILPQVFSKCENIKPSEICGNRSEAMEAHYIIKSFLDAFIKVE